MHIAAKIDQLALWHGDRTAIVDSFGAWSFRQLHERITRFGNAMHGLGLKAGDRIALLVPDIREYLEADYGAMAAGFVRVPIDPRLTRRDFVALLRHAQARALITHPDFAKKIEGLRLETETLKWIIHIGGGGIGLDYEDLLGRASDQALTERHESDLASLNFSGGTTGSPKAVMLRHRNLMAVAQNTIAGFDISARSVFLNVRPLWPIAQVILMAHLFAGATVVLGGPFDPEQLQQQIQQSGATRTSLVPTQLVRALDHWRPNDEQLRRLEAIYVGGSRIPPPVFERAFELIGARIGVLYGMTEAPVTCYLPPESLASDALRRRQLMESVGHELFGYQVRIAPSAETPAEATGEVLIRGDNVMAGYWQDDPATGRALRGGWLHTGDIGWSDGSGNLYIVGRLNDVIRSGSSNIIPKEVEDAIGTHPAVSEVAVLGVPDIEWGEAVTAFVVLKPGMGASEADLVKHCREQLAGYKKPRAVRFVASLPRSHYGKVIRAELLAQAGKL
ncbi:MAG TPA: AMP-binding protein [Xanthobacteraceae bacterium]|jgi:acyl-CoA synthetase (AMP-forming)/AMP-acid ligase II